MQNGSLDNTHKNQLEIDPNVKKFISYIINNNLCICGFSNRCTLIILVESDEYYL